MKDNETIFKRTCSINFRTNHSIFCHIGDLFFRWLFYGPILFVGLFIGVDFFVSAGSFLYFRLYMDLDEDKQKFSSIAKMGLTVKELKKVLTRQTAILFFAPIIVAFIHRAVALAALSNLFEFNIFKESVMVLGVFLIIQIIYFFIVRVFYTKQIQAVI